MVNLGRFAEISLLEPFLQIAVFGPLHVNPSRHPVVLVVNQFSYWEAKAALQDDDYGSSGYDVEAAAERDDESTLECCECCREWFQMPDVLWMHSAELALKLHGRDTGVVVDLGLGVVRATPVLNGSVVKTAIQCQFSGAANVTNLLLEQLSPAIEQARELQPTQLSGFEIMLAVKGVKEEQLEVAPSRAEALRLLPLDTTTLHALSAALGQPIQCGNELARAAELFFSPGETTSNEHSYFGPLSPAPNTGIHQLVQQAAAAAGLPPGFAVSVIGGSSGIKGMAARLDAELRLLGAGHGCILPIAPEAAWAGGALVGASWEPETGGVAPVDPSSDEPLWRTSPLPRKPLGFYEKENSKRKLPNWNG